MIDRKKPFGGGWLMKAQLGTGREREKQALSTTYLVWSAGE